MEIDPGLTIRAFLALPLASSFHSDISPFLENLNSKFPAVRWIKPGELHLTLHFFGSIQSSDVERISAAVRPCCEQIPPLEINLENLGGFPDLQCPRVIWLGVGGEESRLRGLCKEIETGLGRLGFFGEGHTFKPHATIGRVRRGSKITGLEKIQFSPVPSRRVNEIILFRSHLTPLGATYEKIAAYPLGRFA